MFSTDYYINDLIGTAEKIRKALVERDDRIKLLTEQSNLGGYRPLQAYPAKNLHELTPITNEDLQFFINKVEEISVVNKAIIAHNVRVKDCIVAFMESMGFRKEESNGSWLFSGRKPKKTVNGWYGEINSKIPVADNEYHRYQSYLADVRRQMVKAENDRVNAENAAKLEAEQEARAKEAHAHLIQMCIKYGLTVISLEELKKSLLERCKYLTLAYYLQQNSYNTEDGFSLARTGMDEFTGHKDYDDDDNSQDYKINDAITTKIDTCDYDNGEVFAMYPYSYLDLYKMVDPALKADFDKTVQYIK